MGFSKQLQHTVQESWSRKKDKTLQTNIRHQNKCARKSAHLQQLGGADIQLSQSSLDLGHLHLKDLSSHNYS